MDGHKTPIDPTELRRAFGNFVTGVTVVTTRDVDSPRGMTANSFTSVSLDPPLLLICVGKSDDSVQKLAEAIYPITTRAILIVDLMRNGQKL